ncbi:MAG: hypothetical protein IJT01_10045 [Selenomonadaceae bacterium]|nr:hypothetical protein [Selenomonadaceae bacterium]
MDLFTMSEEGGQNPDPLGFRLDRLEVYNWGTFHDKVWSLELQGDTSLLTGDVGSGKSTLVDAILTLLVPPKRVTYNQAADAGARERSIRSYVLGFYGQKSTEEGGGIPESLRDKNSYSVILGVFCDRNFSRTVTLAQVFWFRDEAERTPRRFFVLAEKKISIGEQFSRIGNDMRLFRKRLESDQQVHTYDDYTQYGVAFRRMFGIRHLQALDLFQQTVSMKKVDSLTDFVRRNMLEEPDTRRNVDNLLRQFHDLEMAHQSVVKAKRQQEMLEPIDATGRKFEEASARREQFQGMRDIMACWFKEKEYEHKTGELKQKEVQAAECKELEEQKRKNFEEAEERLGSVRREMEKNGGQQLEAMENERKLQEMKKVHREAAVETYGKYAKSLGLGIPENEKEFAGNRDRLQEMLEEAGHREEELVQEHDDFRRNYEEAERSAKELEAEIHSLRQRKSNIPREFVDLRQRLCEDLELAEDELPFAGELMAVREEEEEWEGAIERLLRGLGISLLVPQVHYGEVANWMEHHHLHMRIVYYRVPEYTEPTDFSSMEEDRVCRKLAFNEDSPYFNWLAAEIRNRFHHVCCESIKDFRQQDFALSIAGQVKTNGRRHEKDDRHDIRDKRQYVLGFSNVKKVQALEEEWRNCEGEKEFFRKKLRANESEKKKIAQKTRGIESLKEIDAFEKIDLLSVEEELRRIRGMIEKLRQENDIYLELEKRAGKLKIEAETLKFEYEDLREKRSQLNGRISTLNEDVNALLNAIRVFPVEKRNQMYPLLEKCAVQALSPNGYEYAKRALQELEYQKWLSGQIKAASDAEAGYLKDMVGGMTKFKMDYPEQTNDIASDPEALEEYRAILERLRRDDLPRFESKFRELLKTNTIHEITLFQNHMAELCREIEERIHMINESLAEIDYNENRYIQLEYRDAPSDMVREFRNQLRACTDDAYTGSDDAYSETKFQQVADIVGRLQGRPNHVDEDRKWCAHVIDVRNWYNFAATERWRETDEEYEHYTDSGGKSGGQKEKLAYTILAASIIYNFGLAGRRVGEKSFRFVVIDEAFLKSSDDSARFGLELFKKLDLQLLVVTPLLKIATIEPFVAHVGFVYQDDGIHQSYLRNLTIHKLKEVRRQHEEKEGREL